MEKTEREKFIIEQYQQNEKQMILLFAQWCINHGLDPEELYKRAYPGQHKNPVLTEALEQTMPKDTVHIPDDTVLEALSLFGNDDLAFVVSEEMDKKKRKNRAE